MSDDGLCVPLFDVWWKVQKKTAKWTLKPLECFNDWFWDLPNAALWACGFCVILIPFYVSYISAFLAVQLAIFIIFSLAGLTSGLVFILIGIWPVLILSTSICGITLITLPKNIYYHALVTYRTVILRRNLKILSFFLLPITHLLIPPVSLIVAFFTLFPWFAWLSFTGYPGKPWKKVPKIFAKTWGKFNHDVRTFAENYGHETGIPQDWDGKVYGLAVDPLVVVIAIFLYCIGLITMTPVIFVIFFSKAVPIFLETLIQFWTNISILTAVVWYIGVLAGTHENSNNQNQRNERTPSSTPGWIKSLKSAVKVIKRGIEGYGKLKIFKTYNKILEKYAEKVVKLDPSKLGKMISSYATDLNPTKVFPKNIGLEIVCLWIPILMVFLMWILGLVLVLTIPPATFLMGFILWLLLWPIVIIAPPIMYIGGWIAIVLGLPILYVFTWCSILIGPWVICILGSVMGPLLALYIPFCMIVYNNFNPIGIWDNARSSLVKGYKVCRAVDRCTTKYSLCKLRIFCGDNPVEDGPKDLKEDRVAIDYWNLYTQRCIQESKSIQTKNWLSPDDVLSVSSTSTIAIPGAAILAILADTAKRNNNKERMLIFWNEDNVCKDSNRDLHDNIAHVFLPQLMRVKESIKALPNEEFEVCINWIIASLCDGEDEKSSELAMALNDIDALKDDGRKRCLQIRASIENIVHALLRVREMSSRLPEIFSSTMSENDEETNSIQNVEQFNDNMMIQRMEGAELQANSNDDPELALALHLSMEEYTSTSQQQETSIED